MRKSDLPKDLRPVVSNYLQLLEKTGKEIANTLKLSSSTKKILEQANDSFDSLIKGS